MDINEKLSSMESTINFKAPNQTVEQQVEVNDKMPEEEKISTENENCKATEHNESENKLTIKDMSYGQVVEGAKKANLVSTAEDKNFVAELSDKNKDVLKASIDLEKEKVEAEKMQIQLEQEKLATEKEQNLNERLKQRFGSKLDTQEYHYKSLQPILETFGIKRAMNIWVMWTIAIIGCLSLIYPIKLLFIATFGNLIAGASADNRKGFAKGCLWTAVAILGIALVSLLIFGVVKLGLYIF